MRVLKFDIRKNLALSLCLGLASVAHSYPTIATPDGYATGTTGGAGGKVVEVSTAAELKAAAESDEKLIIVVMKDLGNVGQFKPKSNKTFVGENASAGYTGNMALTSVSNIIVQNLTIKNPDGIGTSDGIEASQECTKIFVTKCHFIDCKDGSFDIKRGTDNVTVSWCRFSYPTITGHNFPNLIGHDDKNASQDKGKLHVTMHHNWYDKGCNSRMPRVRFGTVHVYNNYYQQADNYAIGTGVYSSIRVENSVFDNIKAPWNDMNGMANEAKIGWDNLSMINGTKTPTYAKNSWEVFTPSYPFRLETLADIKSIVTNTGSGAGNTHSQPVSIKVGNHTDDLQVSIDAGVLQIHGTKTTDHIVVRDIQGKVIAQFGAQGGALPAAAPGILLVQVYSENGAMSQFKVHSAP